MIKLTMDDWSPEDIEAAKKEGWDLYNTYGSEYGTPQLQRCDDLERFPDDEKAGDYVLARARGGSLLHQKALAVLEGANPTELEYVLRIKTALPREHRLVQYGQD